MNNNNYAVIMAGGVGSRFWPVSRTTHPKQFIDIVGTGKTLIQGTFDRLKKVIPAENIFVVTNELYVSLVKEQLPGISQEQILAEPVMRNTAPCIAYACYKISALNPNANILVAPSDHLILDTEEFARKVTQALNYAANNDALVTLGIKPSRPDTGYGYIKIAEVSDEAISPVERFMEKPNLELAKEFVASGNYFWNAGIFIWSARTIGEAFKKYSPEIEGIFADSSNYNTSAETEFLKNEYAKSPNISIDYAILEKASNVYVIPSDFGWSDLGTWSSVYTLSLKDDKGNAAIPPEKVLFYNSSGCMVNVPADKLVVLSKLNDYIIVEANNTLIICPKDEEQIVKQFVADVKERFGIRYI